MLRNLFIVGLIISLTLIGIRWSLEDRKILGWADRALEPDSAAALDSVLGEVFYTGQDYVDAEVLFDYVYTHYPKSPSSESARLMWLQCLCHTHHLTTKEIILECQNFIEKYPNSPQVTEVRKIILGRQQLSSNQMDVNLSKP